MNKWKWLIMAPIVAVSTAAVKDATSFTVNPMPQLNQLTIHTDCSKPLCCYDVQGVFTRDLVAVNKERITELDKICIIK